MKEKIQDEVNRLKQEIALRKRKSAEEERSKSPAGVLSQTVHSGATLLGKAS